MRDTWIFSGLGLVVFISLGVFELHEDDRPTTPLALALEVFEMGMFGVGVATIVYLIVGARKKSRHQAKLVQDLKRARAEGSRWRATAQVHTDGLSKAISKQLAEWGLTQSESDVSVLMLKGLSHKDIADLRQSSESTVRQHATTIYRKSGLSSRAELAAFFLEDLLPSTHQPEALSPAPNQILC